MVALDSLISQMYSLGETPYAIRFLNEHVMVSRDMVTNQLGRMRPVLRGKLK